jgi:hypothetical protein
MSDTSTTSPVDDARPLKPSLVKRLRKLPLTLYLGGTLVSLFVLVAMVSFVWTPYPANKLNLTNRLAPPGTPGFLFGTDRAGRDVVTELMLGARNSLYVSVVSTIIAMSLGALIGLSIAGSRRTLQGPFTRLVDAGLALPGILTALVLAAKLGPGNTTATLAIITWQVPVAARVTIGPARQSRVAKHQPTADRAWFRDVRSRNPHRGCTGLLERGGPAANFVVGSLPQRNTVAARSSPVPHVLPRRGNRVDGTWLQLAGGRSAHRT